MLLSVINILLPVILLFALGMALRRSGFIDEAFASRLLRLVFYTALPCTLIVSISRAESLGGVGGAAFALCGVTAVACGIAALAAQLSAVPRGSVPSLCQTSTRGNAAYVGLPVIALATTGTALEGDAMRVTLRPAALAVVLKLVVCPLLGAAAVEALGLPPAHRFVVLVYLACPCSTSSYIMDKAMGGDADLSGAAVVLSTVLCAIPAGLVILAFR